MNWEQRIINLDNGLEANAIAPLIVSASRSTDIPAFYSKWLFNRLEKGYISWTNPFNQKVQYISLEKTRFFIFWTKNPFPIIPYLDILDKKGIGYYFQITLNDYVDEGLEPNVPSLEQRIDTFISLSKLIGKHKVIWRSDPLLLSGKLNIARLLEKIRNIGSQINTYTEKLVFSFADINVYRKVVNNLGKAKENYREFTQTEINNFTEQLQLLNSKWNLKLATCAENVDLNKFGVSQNRCIDDELIYRIKHDDDTLLDFLGYKKSTYGLFNEDYLPNPKLKDKGQRKACGCIISKDIGMYNTCNHLCAYCYANSSADLVQKNFEKHTDNSHSII